MPKISIAGLDQVELIARLYEAANYAGAATPGPSYQPNGQTMLLMATLQRQMAKTSQANRKLVRKCIDNKTQHGFLSLDYEDFGQGLVSMRLMINNHTNEISTDGYDDNHGQGKAEEVINSMRAPSIKPTPGAAAQDTGTGTAADTSANDDDELEQILATLAAGRARLANRNRLG
jgi:hypothetical protein